MGKKRHECCRDHKLSVFFGGKNTKELKGIKSKDVKGWLKNRFSYNFVHIRKDPDWGHGFVHFENDDDKTRFYNYNTQNQSLQSPVQPPLSQPSPQSSPLQLPPPQSPQSSPVQLPPPQSPQPSQSQLPAYNIFEVEINSCLIVDIFIFNVKNLSVDVNINNTKLIFVKFEYDLPKDPEGSNCLLREAVFPDKEVILNLELPKRQVYILN
ncbi:uncharacterized protein OCT59_011482 [Rhizophagus irregularis]|uniref:uncharacterized protein n=1 Tax=Rhizophagus irregularis TaxID=588596 RepID=UPI003333F8EF|nr:hypothetical protein OCT59_011482 [Rhizophagus irregularis]